MDPRIFNKMKKVLSKMITKQVISYDADSSSNTNGEVVLSFNAPSSDFVAELGSNPTISCYLIGMSEDVKRRASESHRSTMNAAKTIRTIHSEPRFIDLSYMLTVWYKDKQGSPDVEHLILGYLVSGLGRFDYIPEEFLAEEEMDLSPFGIALKLFGNEHSDKINGQIWQAMGSTPKPCLMLSVSIPVDVNEVVRIPIVQEIEKALDKNEQP